MLVGRGKSRYVVLSYSLQSATPTVGACSSLLKQELEDPESQLGIVLLYHPTESIHTSDAVLDIHSSVPRGCMEQSEHYLTRDLTRDVVRCHRNLRLFRMFEPES